MRFKSMKVRDSFDALTSAFWGIAMGAVLAACGSGCGYAQQSSAETKDATADAASAGDRFAIPDGGAKQLQKFMHELATAEPEGDSEQEQAEFADKLLKTMVEAADRLLAAKPTPGQARDAFEYKIRALALMAQRGDPAAEQLLAEAVEAARSDERPQVAGVGWQFTIQLQQNQWDDLTPSQRQEFKALVLAAVADGEASRLDVSIVRAVADAFERVDNAFVSALLAETLPALQRSRDGEVKKALAQSNLEGLMRRMNLLGNPMEITGEWLDGSPVDWNSYRGKVVLVDFWATWCGPCRQELPNVLEMYKAYHDKGFDVIGVSLDKRPEDARKYVEQMNLPWSSIFPKDAQDRGWNHPLAQHYGISGIPTAILVDKDGKVVHLEARAEALRDELHRLLGPPSETDDSDSQADIQ